MHTTLISAAVLATCSIGLATPGVTAAHASAPDASTPTTTPIRHLVVVFQENASFDHYFGTYPNAANPPGDPPFVARTDKETPTVNNLLPSSLNGNRALLTTNPNLSKPFRLDRTQFVTCSQDHSYKAEQRAANQGRMDRFVQQTDKSGCPGLPVPVPSPQVMGYFDGNTLTSLWNYAQHYALDDEAFGTTYGPSTPGALNLVAGRTSGATPDNGKTVTEGVAFGDADPTGDVCSDPAKTQATLSGTNVGDRSRRPVSPGAGSRAASPSILRATPQRPARRPTRTSRARRRRTTPPTTTRSSTSSPRAIPSICHRPRTPRSGTTTRRTISTT